MSIEEVTDSNEATNNDEAADGIITTDEIISD